MFIPLPSSWLLFLPCVTPYGLLDFEECKQKVLWQPHTPEPNSVYLFPGPAGVVGEHLPVGALTFAQQSPMLCWPLFPSHAIPSLDSERQKLKIKENIFVMLCSETSLLFFHSAINNDQQWHNDEGWPETNTTMHREVSRRIPLPQPVWWCLPEW